MTIQEKWFPIPGYEEIYSISNHNRVRRDIDGLKTSKAGHTLKPLIDSNGYLRVTLYKNGSAEYFLIHRIIAHIFIGPCPKGEQVNHKDWNKLNNDPENLEYCSASENMFHSYNVLGRQAARGERSNLSKLTEKQVIEIRQQYIQENISQRELGIIYDVTRSTISDILSKRTWKHI